MAVFGKEQGLQFTRRRDGVSYVAAENASSRAALEGLQASYPGSYIQWESAGLLITGPNGKPKMSEPTWVLWRPVGPTLPPPPAPPPEEPEPLVEQPEPDDELPELEDPATFLDAPPSAHGTAAATLGAVAPQPSAAVEAVAPAIVAQPASRRGRARRPRSEKSVKHKNITRVDRDRPGRAPEHGFHVRLSWKREVFQKWFSDKAHGDRLGALAAALAWRDAKERELGKPRSEHGIKGQDVTSNTGIVGVSRLDVDGHPYYRALWRDPEGRQHVRFFRIDRLGEKRALRAAVKARQEGIAWQLK
jgi:hypothetical protein